MASKDKKALGTGLGVLFGESSPENEEQITLSVSKIEPRKEQPREYFDEDALQNLADSISQYGMIQPITVRRLDSGFYQIIAGERRWRAARLAGLVEVPVRIIDADDRMTAELALVENLQRENLNPVEEAKGYQTLIDQYGLTQEETAKSVGKSRSTITNSLRILNLSADVLKMVETGDLSVGHAKALLSIEDPALQFKTAKEIQEKSLSVRKAELMAAKASKIRESPPKTDPSDLQDGIDYAKEVSAELTKKLGRKVFLRAGKTSGKIEIDYYSADDRENLINLLRTLNNQ